MLLVVVVGWGDVFEFSIICGRRANESRTGSAACMHAAKFFVLSFETFRL